MQAETQPSEVQVPLKAYDPMALLAKLKSEGLEVGEEAAKVLVKAVFSWVQESAAVSATQIDDMVAGLLKPAEVYVLGQLEKINPADAPTV